jgi:hypothetical protein
MSFVLSPGLTDIMNNIVQSMNSFGQEVFSQRSLKNAVPIGNAHRLYNIVLR